MAKIKNYDKNSEQPTTNVIQNKAKVNIGKIGRMQKSEGKRQMTKDSLSVGTQAETESLPDGGGTEVYPPEAGQNLSGLSWFFGMCSCCLLYLSAYRLNCCFPQATF